MTLPIMLDLKVDVYDGETLSEVLEEQRESLEEGFRILSSVRRGLEELLGRGEVLFSAQQITPKSRKDTRVFKLVLSFLLHFGSRLEIQRREYQVDCTVWYSQSRWEVSVDNKLDRNYRKIAYNKKDEELAATIAGFVKELDAVPAMRS